jgi:hypothetical protein
MVYVLVSLVNGQRYGLTYREVWETGKRGKRCKLAKPTTDDQNHNAKDSSVTSCSFLSDQVPMSAYAHRTCTWVHPISCRAGHPRTARPPKAKASPPRHAGKLMECLLVYLCIVLL